MIRRVRDRASFAALSRARRHRRGPVSLRFVAGGSDVRVAYAIGRGVGNAVTRNRARRRLREAVSRLAADLPAGAYLVGATAAATTVPFAELEHAVAEAMQAATGDGAA